MSYYNRTHDATFEPFVLAVVVVVEVAVVVMVVVVVVVVVVVAVVVVVNVLSARPPHSGSLPPDSLATRIVPSSNVGAATPTADHDKSLSQAKKLVF